MGTVTNFPFGLSSFGAVLGGGQNGLSIPRNNGQAWFVDAAVGSDGGTGTSPSDPFKTIGRAVSLAGNGTGDTIYVSQGSYNETVVVTKDALAIVGFVQAGYEKPDWAPAAITQIPLVVKAQGFLCRHIRFAGNAADCCVQGGNGFLYEDCVFDGDLTATKAGLRLLPVAVTVGDTSHTASEGTVAGNLFRGCAFGLVFDTAVAPLGVGSTDNLVINNRFYANTIDVEAAKSGAAGTYSLQTTDFLYNVFADKNKTTYVDLLTNIDGPAASQTGMFVNNFFAANTLNSTSIKATGTGFTFVQTFSTAVAAIIGTTFAA